MARTAPAVIVATGPFHPRVTRPVNCSKLQGPTPRARPSRAASRIQPPNLSAWLEPAHPSLVTGRCRGTRIDPGKPLPVLRGATVSAGEVMSRASACLRIRQAAYAAQHGLRVNWC
jgi:hypothetical protein